MPFFHPAEWPDPGNGPYGRIMVNPESRRYRVDALVAYEFADVYVLGTDGVLMMGDGILQNTLDQVATWLPESNIEQIINTDFLRLRRPMAVKRFEDEGRYVIGYNGAWQNHGHWLPQCLPRLYAFTLLLRIDEKLKIVLPPLRPGSAQAQTLRLLGIRPEQVCTVPKNETVGFGTAIIMPDFEIWNISSFAAAAADAVIAGLPAEFRRTLARPDKVYIHRTVSARRVLNFDTLRQVLEHYGFVICSFEDMDLVEQVATMKSARYVVSEHGAGTANILFCNEGTRVLELFSPFCVQPAFWSIASRRKLDYGYIVGNHTYDDVRLPPDWNSAYEIPPDKLEDGIRSMLLLAPEPAFTATTLNPKGFWMLVHIAMHGDLYAKPEAWAGCHKSAKSIEGFELRPLSGISRHEVSYRALLLDETYSAWVSAGEFCGSRGASRPLLGFSVRLSGKAAERLQCVYYARFVDGTEAGPFTEGVCRVASGAALEGMLLLLLPRRA